MLIWWWHGCSLVSAVVSLQKGAPGSGSQLNQEAFLQHRSLGQSKLAIVCVYVCASVREFMLKLQMLLLLIFKWF